MNEESYDIAVAGDTVFAAALSLALARNHGARVCLIGQGPAPLQATRDVVLSLGPYSRPETLRLLAAHAGDLRALLRGPGDPVFERRNVAFTATSAAGRAAAGHARHMLMSFGNITSLLPESGSLGGFVAEGVWSLKPATFFSTLPARLAAAGIASVPKAETLQIGQDLVRFAFAHTFATAKLLIVTDASQIGALPTLPIALSTSEHTAVLTDRVPGLAGRLFVDVESGGFVSARADGRLEAVVPASDDAGLARWLGGFLPAGATAHIVAKSRFPVLLSHNGAPVVGRLPRKAAIVATGFGVSGAFLAPSVARHLMDAAAPDEADWFAPRTVSGDRSTIAEIGLVGGGTP